MNLKVLIGCLGLLGAVAFMDYVTSYELLLYFFYLIPVSIAAWILGRKAAWGMAVLAALVWVGVDYFSAHQYSMEFYRYWNVAMFFGSFATVGELLARLRVALETAKRTAEAKEAALRELRESTLRLRDLEGSMQTVCAWTNQIKDGDQWVSFPEFLERHLKVQTTHGISPAGMEIFRTKPPVEPPPPA